MSTNNKLLAALACFTMILGVACTTLRPQGTFPADGVQPLVEIVVERTTAYVENDAVLTAEEVTDRVVALQNLDGLLRSATDITFEAFKAASEQPLTWHDAYVLGDISVPSASKPRMLRSTEMLREKFWPME